MDRVWGRLRGPLDRGKRVRGPVVPQSSQVNMLRFGNSVKEGGKDGVRKVAESKMTRGSQRPQTILSSSPDSDRIWVLGSKKVTSREGDSEDLAPALTSHPVLYVIASECSSQRPRSHQACAGPTQRSPGHAGRSGGFQGSLWGARGNDRRTKCSSQAGLLESLALLCPRASSLTFCLQNHCSGLARS